MRNLFRQRIRSIGVALTLLLIAVPLTAEPRTWKDPILGIEFVYAEANTFWMGSPASETGRYEDEHRHRAELTRGFWISVTELTQGQFEEFIQDQGYETEAEQKGSSWYWNGEEWEDREGVTWRDSGGQNHPVAHVTWNDARAFCTWLSERSGQSIRLPTEAEWEYAARSGRGEATSAGDLTIREDCDAPELEAIAWYCGNSDGKAHPVGEKEANPWNLHDMLGNIWEWTADFADWDEKSSQVASGTYEDKIVDPIGKRGSRRVLRGGSWKNSARDCRAANREADPPGTHSGIIGFRIVRSSP